MGIKFSRLIRRAGFMLSKGREYKQDFHISGFKPPVRKNDIYDHLNSLYWHAMEARPEYLVELGTRGGESTKVLLCAARDLDVKMLSVDINDCGGIEVDDKGRWTFIQSDDVEFGQRGFQEWCHENNLSSKAGFVFIDTSHLYDHTRAEIDVWVKNLALGGTMVFHDTNMGNVYARLDGSLGYGWDNNRGVIRAIEDLLGRRYDENAFFVDYAAGFLIRHYPNCSGMTVIKKMAVL